MDFHDFTSIEQFDQTKINHFARLDSIPGFCLLRSEREYLECYRNLLRAATKDVADGPKGSIYLEDETAAPEVEAEEEKPAKKTRKTTKAETPEE